MTVQELLIEKGRLVKQARDLIDAAESEKRDFNAEEKEKYDKLNAEIDGITARVERTRALEALEAEERAAAHSRVPQQDEIPEDRKKESWQESFRKAVYSMRTGENMQIRAATDPQTVGTDAAGGYTVPNEWFNELQVVRSNANIMRGLARVIQTSSGQLNVPTVSAHGAASWYTENSAIAVAQETFGTVALNAYKAGRIITISKELLNDSMFDLASYLANEIGRSIGQLEEAGFVTGDNSNKPNGIFTAATTGKTAASATAITTDELLDLYHSVGTSYRGSGTWIMADGTLLLVRKLKDGNSNYIWQPGLQNGIPDRLLGRPVAISSNAPAATSGLDSVLFGDVRGYWIADRVGLELQRLDELYAVNDLVGFKATLRTDGELVDSAAVRVLTML